MPATTFSNEDQREILHELLTLVSKHNLRTSIGALLAILFMFLVVSPRVTSSVALYGWLIFAICAQFNRIYALRRPMPLPLDELLSRKQYYLASALIASSSHITYFYLFFAVLSEPERCFITLLMLGLCSGSVANNAGLRSGFVCFSLPLVATTVIFWFVTEFSTLPKWLDLFMAVIIVFYGAVLNEMSKNTHDMIQETFRLRFEDRKQKRLLRTALDEAELANKTKTRFLAAASHDLRQPLHTISLVSAALDLQALQPETQKLVNILSKVSLSLSRQLSDLLDISKLDAGIVDVHIQPIQINILLNNIASEFELEINEKGLVLELELRSTHEAMVDPQLMYRILRNLVHNAVKFTEAGKILLRTCDRDGFVIIEVIDTGCGIAQPYQREIFHEFFQINNEGRDRTKGFGLGLSIVARLTKLLNIQMRLDSTINQGSTFSLTIANAFDRHVTSPLNADALTHPADTFSLTVLIVEDDELVKQSTRYLLEQLGCTCLEASETKAAVEIATNNTPDLVLADYRLGNNDNGVLAIQAIQQQGHIPAVLITGDTAPGLLKEMEATGLQVIHKPLTFQKLFAVLESTQKNKQARA